MSWYALENIEEALQRTRDLLLPLNAKQWAKLALIILLTGYVAGGPSYFNFPTGSGSIDSGNQMTGDFSASPALESFDVSNAFILLGAASLLTLITVLTYVTSVFRFVMYRSLIKKNVKIGYATEYLYKGLQYFVFRWATLFAALIILSGAVWTGLTLNLSFNVTGVLTGIALALLALTGVVVIAGLRWVVFNLSLPDMVEKDRGLLKALKASTEALKEDFAQVALFWFMKALIALGLGIAAMTVLFSALMMLLIPFVFIGILMAFVSPLLLVPVVLIYLVSALVVALAVAVPVQVYLYNYIIENYRDIVQ
ncbi:MAG: hypothetical protein ACLFRK_00710 [Candidatus Nanohaloarchaea archaeon]